MKTTRFLTSTFTNELDLPVMLSGESPSRAHRGTPKRLSRGVAVALVGLVCLAGCAKQEGSIKPIQKPTELTDKQIITRFVKTITSLKQYNCFYDLAYRESRWSFTAKNGSHYGFMQGRSNYLKTATPMKQLLWSWDYVSVRYGVTALDEPDWCKALQHLKTKGWH